MKPAYHILSLNLSLMTQFRFNRGIEEQTKAFLEGMNEVVPLQWLQYFDERELEVSVIFYVLQPKIVNVAILKGTN